MPRRAAPGNRDRIEAALSDDLHAALATICESWEVPFGQAAEGKQGWLATPIGQVFETVVIAQRTDRLVATGMTLTCALHQASREFGVPCDTVRNRLERAYAASRESAINSQIEGCEVRREV